MADDWRNETLCFIVQKSEYKTGNCIKNDMAEIQMDDGKEDGAHKGSHPKVILGFHDGTENDPAEYKLF